MFYTSCIKNRIDYGVVIYGYASKTILNKVEFIQKTALRIIGGYKKITNITFLLVETNTLPINL